MDAALARRTDRLDLVLFIPQTPELLVLVHDVILLCALEPAGGERLPSANLGIQLGSKLVPPAAFTRLCSCGKRSVALTDSAENQDRERITHRFSQGGLQSTGERLKGRTWANARQSSTPPNPSTQLSELVHDINSQHRFHFSLLPRAEVKQIGASTFWLCHRFLVLFCLFFSRSAPSVRLAAGRTQMHESKTRKEAFHAGRKPLTQHLSDILLLQSIVELPGWPDCGEQFAFSWCFSSLI